MSVKEIPLHLTSMKKESGPWTRRFFLCISFSLAGLGFKRSTTNYKGGPGLVKKVQELILGRNHPRKSEQPTRAKDRGLSLNDLEGSELFRLRWMACEGSEMKSYRHLSRLSRMATLVGKYHKYDRVS